MRQPEHHRPRATVLFVLGMHRSGTSAFAGVLHCLGVHLGDRLIPAAESNERGHFEHIEMMAINNDLLWGMNSCWADVRSLPPEWSAGDAANELMSASAGIIRRETEGHELWAVKDPRLSRLIPPHLRAADLAGVRPVFSLLLRHPMEVALSLRQRDQLPINHGLALWLRYTLDAEQLTLGQQRVRIPYARLLADPLATLENVNLRLELTIRPDIKAVSEFISSSLRHFRETVLPDNAVGRLAGRVWSILSVASDSDHDHDLLGTLADDAAAVLDEFGRGEEHLAVAQALASLEQTTQRLSSTIEHNRQLEAERIRLSTLAEQGTKRATVAEGRLAMLRAELDTNRATMDQQAKVLAASTEHNRQLEAERIRLGAIVEQVTEQVTDAERRIAVLNDELQTCQSALERTSKVLENATEHNRQLDAERVRLSGNVSRVESTLAHLEQQFEAARQSLQAEQTRCRSLESELTGARQQIAMVASLQRRVESLDRDLLVAREETTVSAQRALVAEGARRYLHQQVERAEAGRREAERRAEIAENLIGTLEQQKITSEQFSAGVRAVLDEVGACLRHTSAKLTAMESDPLWQACQRYGRWFPISRRAG